MSKRSVTIFLVVLVAVIVLFFLNGGSEQKQELLVGSFGSGNQDSQPRVEASVSSNAPQLASTGYVIVLVDLEIRAEKGKFIPATVAVNNGDVITVRFTAVDADYNIFFPDFGVYMEAQKGKTVKRQFQAAPYGEYEFLCRDCGNSAKGTLMVNEKGSILYN